MIRRIVLVGPPGSGKSTLIKLARTRNIEAVDLEDYGPTKEDRITKVEELMKDDSHDLVIFGGADVGGHFPDDLVERVLLLPTYKDYLQRFQERDEDDQTKKAQNQNAEQVWYWFKEMKDTGQRKYNKVIEAIGTAEETLDEILKPLT